MPQSSQKPERDLLFKLQANISNWEKKNKKTKKQALKGLYKTSQRNQSKQKFIALNNCPTKQTLKKLL